MNFHYCKTTSMRKYIRIILFFIIPMNLFSQEVHHKLNATIIIKDHSIELIDEIIFTKDYLMANPDLVFTLNANLKVHSADEKTVIKEITREEDKNARVPVKTYRIKLPRKAGKEVSIRLAYSGIINDDISTGAAEYARGFSETSGIISEKGIYLAGSSQWIPRLNNVELFTYVLDVTLDPEWSNVSQ